MNNIYAGYQAYIISFSRMLFVLAVLLIGVVEEGYGQRVYANLQRNSAPSGTSITNPGNSVDANYSNFTALSASSFLFASSAWQQLIFPTTVPANTPVYIKVTSASGLLGGGVAAQAYANSHANGDGSTVPTTSTSFTSIDGMTYIAVSSASPFNAVRLTLSSPAVAGTSTLNIYYAFFDPSVSTNCAEVIGTSVGGSGISLGGGVSNQLNAVDGNLTTYSAINGGLLGVGNTITQSAHFSTRSNVGDAATVTFSVPPALLQLSLFNNVVINTYNGLNTTPVSSSNLNTLLSLDLLGLLSTGGRYTVSVSPGVPFDRIEVSLATGVSLLGSFRVHEIQRTPAKPVTPTAYPDVIEICDGETVSISAASPSAGSVLRWYDTVSDGTLLQESATNSDTYTTEPLSFTALTDTVFRYVSAAWNSGCLAESERTKIAIVVHPKPTVSPIVGSLSVCETETTTLFSETSNGVWTSMDESIATIDASGLVRGISMGTTTIQYTVAGLNSSCTTTAVVQLTVLPQPGRPHLTITDVRN